MAETEQNKTEEPTPFKLKRSREKGMIARGADLGFFSMLAALILFALIAGAKSGAALLTTMRLLLSDALIAAADPHPSPAHFAALTTPVFMAIAPLGAALLLGVATFEIIQARGILFTAQPLKPDFSRLNPAQGLKRIFSARMLKETLKSILKLAVYAILAYLVVASAREKLVHGLDNPGALARAMNDASMRLLFAFALAALVFALADQVLARTDFLKRMRMSRGEVSREHRDREGDQRIKQKRKQLHAAFAKQADAVRKLPGSDMLIVNPQHYAVALVYDSAIMSAPKVTAKGKNNFALLMKKRAALLSVPIFESRELARLLYREVEVDGEAPPHAYRPIADLYIRLRRAKQEAAAHA